MSLRWTAYIDESGVEWAPRQKDTDSPWFINASVIAQHRSDAAHTIGRVKSRINQKSAGFPKFVRLEHHSKLAMTDEIAASGFTGLVVLIDRLSRQEGAFPEPHLMYRWSINLLLERISKLAKAHGQICDLVFSARKGASPEALNNYLSKLQKTRPSGKPVHNHSIAWDWLNLDFAIEQEAKNPGLRVADAVASAFGQAMNPVRSFTEPRFAVMLKPIIAMKGGIYQGAGVKIYPPHSTRTSEIPKELVSAYGL